MNNPVLISKLYMDQSVKIRQSRGETISRMDEKLDKDVLCRRFYSTCTANFSPRKLWKCFGGLKMGVVHMKCSSIRFVTDIRTSSPLVPILSKINSV